MQTPEAPVETALIVKKKSKRVKHLVPEDVVPQETTDAKREQALRELSAEHEEQPSKAKGKEKRARGRPRKNAPVNAEDDKPREEHASQSQADLSASAPAPASPGHTVLQEEEAPAEADVLRPTANDEKEAFERVKDDWARWRAEYQQAVAEAQARDAQDEEDEPAVDEEAEDEEYRHHSADELAKKQSKSIYPYLLDGVAVGWLILRYLL